MLQFHFQCSFLSNFSIRFKREAAFVFWPFNNVNCAGSGEKTQHVQRKSPTISELVRNAAVERSNINDNDNDIHKLLYKDAENWERRTTSRGNSGRQAIPDELLNSGNASLLTLLASDILEESDIENTQCDTEGHQADSRWMFGNFLCPSNGFKAG